MVLRRSRVAFLVVLAVLGATVVSGVPASQAVDPADATAAADAAAWIVTRQQPDGGFELAGFPGFETPDAVLAIAEAAQTGAAWSTSDALAAVEALEYGGPGGPTPIDALDTWVTGGINAGEAAKLILLVTAPLGLDPTAFGPSHTDLSALVYPDGCGMPPDLTGLFFYEQMFAGFGGEILCGAPDAGVLTAVRNAQRSDGGWNFNGSTAPIDPDDPFDPDMPDVDTTAIAVEVLIAGGAAWNDPAITKALGYLAAAHQSTGAFPAFGADDPNATAVASLAIAAAGFDPNHSCWRDTVSPAAVGSPYATPASWIRSQQQPEGHIASPNEAFLPVNTFSSAQSVQGLLLSWLPIARATGAPTCVQAAGVQTADPVALVVRFTG